MMFELVIGLSFVLAVVSLISVLFTEKKAFFAISALAFLGVFYFTNSTHPIAEVWPLISFVAGVTLLALEIFIPSFGLIGICGLVLVGLSLYNSFMMDGREVILLVAATLAIILSVTVYVTLGFRANIFDKEILKSVNSRERGYNSKVDYSHLLAKRGRTKSILRPTGRIEIDGKYYDATSQGDFIKPLAKIEVVSVKDGHIVVKEI
ncbi:NfeD family protein [Anaerococcus prevotii]|uniref:Uncharacterized protein n=1 Tax=Anaerococcus prevotii (strain ATCC 9321 / DSM 20548 / JCM 6508 / NCTC 11806 / PC1) TaxID=525919 RepID=C7RFW6_ANAPD|nr:NfeD family protein [Anaerococcus prevotii]ACV28377.1 protein of unknown function DUF107 [Anaerococcus prevotii DSM 20548]